MKPGISSAFLCTKLELGGSFLVGHSSLEKPEISTRHGWKSPGTPFVVCSTKAYATPKYPKGDKRLEYRADLALANINNPPPCLVQLWRLRGNLKEKP